MEQSENIFGDEAIAAVGIKCECCSSVFGVYPTAPSLPSVCPLCKRASNKTRKIKTLPSSGYSSLLPYQIPQVKEFLERLFPDAPPMHIVDATVHIGGDALHFAKLWPNCKITAIDIDQNAIECLKINVPPILLPNFNIICADSTKWIKETLTKADFYYFDPPWGGPSYCSEEEFSLSLGDLPITVSINFILDNDLSSRVILKAPRNFSYTDFKTKIHGTTFLRHVRKPQKQGSIAYSLILITKP